MCCSGRVTRELLGTSQEAQGLPVQTAAGGDAACPLPTMECPASHPSITHSGLK